MRLLPVKIPTARSIATATAPTLLEALMIEATKYVPLYDANEIKNTIPFRSENADEEYGLKFEPVSLEYARSNKYQTL
jgi:hypothetical protein